MRKLTTGRSLSSWMLAVLLLFSADLRAQQESLYSNSTFSQLSLNPGYAGSREAISMAALYRHQWAGVPGAPQTSSFGIHSALKNRRIALGLHFNDDRQGNIRESGIWTSYAYRLQLGPGRLSLGIDAGLSSYRWMLAQTDPIEATDPLLLRDQSLWLPNFGFGAYYYTANWFFGASVPRLINNGLGGELAASQLPGAHRYRHHYLSAGGVISLSESIKLRGTGLLKWVANAPAQVDVAGSLLLKERIWLGASYRSNASMDFHLETNITPYLRVLYAYDFVLGRLGQHSSGSHEVGVGLDLQFDPDKGAKARDLKPRYF